MKIFFLKVKLQVVDNNKRFIAEASHKGWEFRGAGPFPCVAVSNLFSVMKWQGVSRPDIFSIELRDKHNRIIGGQPLN